MNNEFFEALKFMGQEKGIEESYIADKIANAIVVALRKDYGGKDIVSCVIDCENQIFTVSVRKNVVEEIEDPNCEVPVIRVYKRTGKKSIWTFAVASGEYKYVFYVPKGSISKEVKLN